MKERCEKSSLTVVWLDDEVLNVRRDIGFELR
jgi:hypothetical protein